MTRTAYTGKRDGSQPSFSKPRIVHSAETQRILFQKAITAGKQGSMGSTRVMTLKMDKEVIQELVESTDRTTRELERVE
jgi:hypothetical protein